jgi:GT2 family glycosyltransferase
LESIRGQTDRPDEILVVCKQWDEASIRSAKNYDRVQVLTVDTEDIGAAVNRGITGAASDIVAMLDDDAAAPSDWISRIRARFQDQNLGALGGRDELVIDGMQIPPDPKASVGTISWYGRVSGNHHLGVGDPRSVEVLKGCNMAVRRSLISGVSSHLRGTYSYRWEDDLCGQVRRSGAGVIYDPRLVVRHTSVRLTADRALGEAHLRFESAHNLAYVQMRHLSTPRKLMWLAFSFLVGQPDDPGIVRIPILRKTWWPAFKGKLSGVRAAMSEAT